ncbi:Condensin complex subunit 2 [Wickerhamomyces ciferrii]|uniref:Condensin complex subunit 2 n=1 Tax=Wickerhamomyces ciferrii (strain ATCC 14091 / BCRC 22168 / CBS 111 / JCM 3599 / NBRC 0793 / NRRL Y-1031 F-60-10) TaxID=1206466 RepID=K0KH73_WICCF|nr:Condensin complex subunit 2 [Wickerhamomyces ciferrii]CCH44565.1 Condensin complex subunit 2 [Wickerhamomyces ciferrii]
MAYVQSKVMKKRLQEKRRVSGASLLRDELDNDNAGKSSLLDSLPAFQQNKGVMMANFEEWIKMATDNKINTTNSWNFALIDYFYDLNVLRESDNNINFQKASATLDGCVKIYSSRVDSVATETGRLLSGLAARKQQEAEQKAKNRENGEANEDGEEGDSDVEVDEDGEPTTKKARRNRYVKKELGDTLVPFESIQVKKLSQELSIDPLFKKTLAEFDEGGAKSLLLNTLHMDNHTRVVFDATTGESKENLRDDEDPDQEEDKVKDEDHDINMEMSGIEEGDINIGDLKHLVYNEDEDLDDLLVCPSFEHLGSVLKDVNRAKSLLNDVNQQNINIPDDFSASHHSINASNAGGNDDFGFDFGGANDFDDDDGGNSFGDLDQEAAAVLFQDENQDPDDEDTKIVANVVDQDLMAYFDHTLRRNWAGPEHWKVKQLKKGKQDLQSSTNNGAEKKRKPKKELVINFMEENDEDEEDKIFAKSKNPTTIPVEQQESEDTHLLPDDVYFSSEQLVRLFLKPDQKLKVFQKKSKQTKFEEADQTRQEDNRQVDATFWADNYKNNDNQDDGFDDYAGGGDDIDFGGPDDFDDGDNIFNTDNIEDKLEFGTQLITGGKKVKSEYVNYSKTAKNVNVKYLKDNLWDAIEVKKEEPERNFSEVVQDIGKLYPKEEKKDLSTSFFFICLLHLANEHSLDLESNEQLTDLRIKGLIP